MQKKIPFILSLVIVGLLLAPKTRAQFRINETFMGSTTQEPMVMGGDAGAFLTAKEGIDSEGEGWLRLTNANTNQKGYAYLDLAFPSDQGVLLEFEYKMWSDKFSGLWFWKEKLDAGDGFSVFLFDADTEEFRIGGYGGSLGYAPHDDGNKIQPGLKNGYLGIGFDVHGNYAAWNEGKYKGAGEEGEGGFHQFISVRGPTYDEFSEDEGVIPASNSNEYLDGSSVESKGNLDYSPLASVGRRPDDQHYYRKMQIELMPVVSKGIYKITVGWKTFKGQEEFVELFSFETSKKPPENLKLGFAASTGGSVNYHEIRNVMATTPGNLYVENTAVKEVLTFDGNKVNTEFEYHFDIYNESEQDLSDILVEDLFRTGVKEPVPDGMLTLTDVDFDGFTGHFDFPILSDATYDSSSFSGIVALDAKSHGRIILKGRLNGMPEEAQLRNEIFVSSETIIEEDMENNLASTETPVTIEGLDLQVEFDDVYYCLVENNSLDLLISNQGGVSAPYKYNDNGDYDDKIVLEIKVEPDVGVAFPGLSGEWHQSDSRYDVDSRTYVFIKKGTGNSSLPAGDYLPNIPLSFAKGAHTSVSIEADLIYRPKNGQEVNLRNNFTSVIMTQQLPPEIIGADGNSELVYCLGSVPEELPIEIQPGNEIKWYDMNGTTIEAPDPKSLPAGMSSFLISQTNGLCESPKVELRVSILDSKRGAILSEDSEICKGGRPMIMDGGSIPRPEGEVNVTFQWIRSVDQGESWEIIPGAFGASYQPASGLYNETWFQRRTIYEKGGEKCYSEYTDEVRILPQNCNVMVNPTLPSRIE